MKHLWKLPLLLTMCVLLILTAALPASAAIETARKHQTPTVENIDTIYAIDHTNQTYHPVPRSDWNRVRTGLTLSTTPSQNENKTSKYVGGFCFVLQDGTQRIYTVSETQVLVGDIPLFASVADRASLEKLSRELCRDNPAYPAMLAYMDSGKITRATFTGYGMTNSRIDTGKPIELDITRAANPEAVKAFAKLMKGLEVTPRSTAIVNAHRIIKAGNNENMDATIEFSTGTTYTMGISNGDLSIYSSDGTRTYTYTFPDYDPRRDGVGTGWNLRADMWELYREGNNYDAAAIFLTKPDTNERTRGAFYSVEDGGLSTMARLGQILDDIRTAAPLSRIQKSERSYLEIHARNADGVMELFELDGDKLTAYYVDDFGRGRSVPLSADDYAWVKGLLNGRERSNRTILLESDDTEPFLFTCSARDPLFGELFDSQPKDPEYPPYTTGAKPDYVKKGAFDCWADTGSLTKTTVYKGGVMVQQSNLLPWTPAKYDATSLYTELWQIIRDNEVGIRPSVD